MKKTATTKSKKPELTSRRAIGVNLLVGKVPPSAYVVYEETWIEGNRLITKINHGHHLRTLPGFSDLNPRSKKEAELNKEQLRPEYYTTIQAASLLMKDIENACVAIDQKRGLKEK